MSLEPGIRRVVSLVPYRAILAIYHRPWLAVVMRGALNRLLPTGLNEVEVASGPLRGLRFALDLQREKYLWLGTYEPWVCDALERYLHPTDVAWDVGAFIGYHTIWMSRRVCPGRILALEPDPINAERLRRNLSLNGVVNVEVLSVAAGARRDRASLERHPKHPSQTRVRPTAGAGCDMIPLDDLLGLTSPPVLVKVDVEGAEAGVLAGASEVLEKVRPVWCIELHGEADDVVIEVLRQTEYRCVRMGKGVEVRADLPVGGPCHLLAIPNERFPDLGQLFEGPQASPTPVRAGPTC